jgi:tetratricopeptide (TPR) repeat protein
MEAPMRVGCRAWRESSIIAGCLLLALQLSLAQKKPGVSTTAGARAVLTEKARVLEARGRPDMAVQLWQQILLSEPNNAEALAGAARDFKLMGAAGKASQALDRLRRVNPNDPNIARIEALSSTQTESDELRRAGELARQGRADDAMRIYRQLYGDHPPNGDISLAYYQTLHATAAGKAAAIAGMRTLVDRNPGEPRYAIALGVMLTYDPRTRAEGIRILKTYPRDSGAQEALRQALIWDSANPASAAELRQYLKNHPQDMEVARNLRVEESKLARMNSGIARTPAERAAFAALNAHRLDEAQTRFDELLRKEPNNGRVAAGMGFLRMEQRNFGAAISYLTQAEQSGYKVRSVENALATSRFWYTMAAATQAFKENKLDVAATDYKAALVMNPRSADALNGLAGVLTKEQQYPAAAGVYEQLVAVQPANPDGWRGLFLSYARDNQNPKALATMARFPAQVKTVLARDPEYLRTLATIYQAQNRNVDAERVLTQALSLPFPDKGTTLESDTKLQYAGILMAAKRYSQAVMLYGQILAENPSNVSAWMGLVSAHHELGQDTQAIAEVQKMPAATYESALADPGFLSVLGAVYQQAGQYEVAQGLLERAARLEIAAGGQPSVALQLQLAAIYLLRNNTEQAYAIYRRVIAGNPERADAWKGLISTLLATNRNSEALQEIVQIPAPVRKQLENDIEFVQSEASLYAATGDIRRAAAYMDRVQAHYARLKTQPPANIDIQNAWLLYNTGNDRGLYAALMRIGGRNDLTVAQREMVQNIWANWSVRRAAAAMANGNMGRAVDILNAASQAFPGNMSVRKAVAGGYARVGRAREALKMFKTIPMQDASSGDFQGAIGAALAANDKTQAEMWLRQALDRYGRDPEILSLAARYEQARGDNQRAADYWRAALAVMPATTPADRLAHELVYPEQDTRPHRAVTAADLQHLLDPDYEPFPRTTKLPPVPAYGPDPYDGSSPDVLTQPQASSQPMPAATERDSASAGQVQSPTAPDSNSVVRAIPAAKPTSPQLFQQQSATRIEIGNTGSGQAVFGGLLVREALYHPPLSDGARWERRPGAITALRPAYGGDNALASAQMHQASMGQTRGSGQWNGESVAISANPPHSMASDAWKGLIFSLMAGNRNAEALQELAKIPPDVRRQLEADIEFVQGIASLYVAAGDTARASEYLNRVENFYLVHRSAVPAGLEIQHAWLLYNMKDDAGLYPVMLRLDARQDLTAAQREQVADLWGNWAVRRAQAAMDNGNLPRGVEILQAASQDYPDNMNVRRAVAGAYARVGRAADAVALFKTIPMDDASAGDYEAAISAALGAKDTAQAEPWLRQALARYPGDPQILGLAARFERVRGNNQRAAEYWRAALAAMPPGASMKSLDGRSADLTGSDRTPQPGDMKRLLDPRNEPLPAVTLPPLPAYAPATRSQAPVESSGPSSALPPQGPRLDAPSNNPLPLPAASQPQSYTGGVNLPPSEQTIDSTERESPPTAAENAQQAQGSHLSGKELMPRTQGRTPGTSSPNANPTPGLRITSEPMGEEAARVQALFAAETDSQLTQGSASAVHVLPNAAVNTQVIQSEVVQPEARPALPVNPGVTHTEVGEYTVAQYTPSAQEAATGAYSVPRKQTAPPEKPAAAVAPAPAKPSTRQRRKIRETGRQAYQQPGQQPSQEPISTLGNAPALNNAPPAAPPAESQQPLEVPSEAQAQPAAPASSGTGLSDQELEQRNLPPLRGPWIRMQRQPNPVSPREEAEMQLRSIESGYSGWLGGTGLINYRSGAFGYDHLAALEAPFEASVPMGYHARFTVVAKPVFLDSGQADGTAMISVLRSTTSGTGLATIPEPIGTLTTTDTTPPAQQNATGIGGEAQLAFPQFAIAGGYTPYGFLVSTFTGRLMWRPGNGPITLSAVRDSEKDSQLSYAGLRDPAGNTLGTLGQIWGGVVYNQGNVLFTRGDAQSGFYFNVGGQYLTGYNVVKNNRVDGNGGAYWRVMTAPEYGTLNIGVNFFAMHYAKNENAFTHGMGGYFSPQAFFLANVPFSFTGHYLTNWHYNMVGGLGVQAFQEDKTPLWPLAGDKSLEVSQGSPMLPDVTSVGPNYDLHGQVAYQISPHWFAGGFFSANNTRNYSAASIGFSVHYMFRAQPSTANGPTGLFPSDGLRPFTVP